MNAIELIKAKVDHVRKDTESTTVILYHSNCNDGYFAAMSTFFGLGMNAICIPIGYNDLKDKTVEECFDKLFETSSFDEALNVVGTKTKVRTLSLTMCDDINLFVVDFSFSSDWTEELSRMFKSVTVIDHHKTSYDDMSKTFEFQTDHQGFKHAANGNFTCIFHPDKSGASMCQQLFFPDEETPTYIRLVEERDLWKKSGPDTDNFAMGIREYLKNKFLQTHRMLTANDGVSGVVAKGEVLAKVTAERTAQAFKQTKYVKWNVDGKDLKVGLVNAPADIASNLGDMIVQQSNNPETVVSIAIIYSIGVDDKGNTKVHYSARSRKDVDCSLVAKHYGGGGHAQASGFVTGLDTLLNIINSTGANAYVAVSDSKPI